MKLISRILQVCQIVGLADGFDDLPVGRMVRTEYHHIQLAALNNGQNIFRFKNAVFPASDQGDIKNLPQDHSVGSGERFLEMHHIGVDEGGFSLMDHI